jgi:hypothetical protein
LNRKRGPKPGPRKLKPLQAEVKNRSGGPPAAGHRFFSKSLARIGAAGSARQTRIRVIEAMTIEATGSQADVRRLCGLAGLPRTTYYRHLAGRGDEAGECELRDLIQRICLRHRFYGYRRVTAVFRRQGMVVNAKKIQRFMREDNLLVQRKAPFLKPPADRPSAFLIVPNLVRGIAGSLSLVPRASIGTVTTERR